MEQFFLKEDSVVDKCRTGQVEVEKNEMGVVTNCPLLEQFLAGKSVTQCWHLATGCKGKKACPFTQEGKVERERRAKKLRDERSAYFVHSH